jgi:hypothetical protein
MSIRIVCTEQNRPTHHNHIKAVGTAMTRLPRPFGGRLRRFGAPSSTGPSSTPSARPPGRWPTWSASTVVAASRPSDPGRTP